MKKGGKPGGDRGEVGRRGRGGRPGGGRGRVGRRGKGKKPGGHRGGWGGENPEGEERKKVGRRKREEDQEEAKGDSWE